MAIDDFSPYAEVHASLPRHRKTYRLSRILSQKRTTIVGMLVFMWTWALDDGTGFIDADPCQLADLMLWDGDPQLLVNAMIASGWLDVTQDGKWFIHDWDKFTGNLQDKKTLRKQQNRDAQAARREKLKIMSTASTPEPVGTITPNVSMTSAIRHANVSTQTKRNESEAKGKENILKEKFGEFQNVLLSKEEKKKLFDKFGDLTEQKIDNLSEYLAANKKHYESHYAVILNWSRRDTDKSPKQEPSKQWEVVRAPRPVVKT